MNKEQINFLENLKEEILTQDNLATRDVMFAVLETKEHYNIDSDCCDYQVMVDDGDTVYRDIDDVIDNFPDFEEELKDLDLESACDYLFEQGYDVRMCGVKEVEEFNFMNGEAVFFTSKACKKFIERNKHNLSSPKVFGISAWNNPEMRTLREIIISTDWDKLDESKEKELDRLEALEKENQELKVKGKELLNDFKETLEIAKKYKKVIDWLKNTFEITLDSKLRISDDIDCVQAFPIDIDKNVVIYDLVKEVLDALDKLEECAYAMKDLPQSNWIDLAENEAELDLKIMDWVEIVKLELLKGKQALLELKAIKDANPSEALKYVNGKIVDLEDDLQHYTMVEKDKCKEFFIREYLKQFTTIKQALLKAQEQEKVLKIIKEKRVIIDLLIDNSYLEDYNNKIIIIYGYASSAGRLLTQEEFDLLKESLNKKIN